MRVASHSRGAHPHRARSGRARRIATGSPSQGRQAPRGRRGPVGLGPPPPVARSARGDAGRFTLCV